MNEERVERMMKIKGKNEGGRFEEEENEEEGGRGSKSWLN